MDDDGRPTDERQMAWYPISSIDYNVSNRKIKTGFQATNMCIFAVCGWVLKMTSLIRRSLILTLNVIPCINCHWSLMHKIVLRWKKLICQLAQNYGNHWLIESHFKKLLHENVNFNHMKNVITKFGHLGETWRNLVSFCKKVTKFGHFGHLMAPYFVTFSVAYYSQIIIPPQEWITL